MTAVPELERLRAIAEQASLVRACQRAYFRTRTQNALNESKAAEKRLDDMLRAHAAAAVADATAEPEQRGLF